MSFGRSLGIGLLSVVGLRVGLILGVVGYQRWTGEEDVFSGRPAALVALALIAALQVGVVFAMLRARGGSLADLGWTTATAGLGRQLALGLGAFVLMATVLIGIEIAAGSTPSELATAFVSASLGQRVTFVGIGLLAAFAEESVFRGHLQPLMAARIGRFAGPFVVAVLFDLYHLQFHPLALVGKLVIGVTLAGLRMRTGALFASAIAHALIWWLLGSL